MSDETSTIAFFLHCKLFRREITLSSYPYENSGQIPRSMAGLSVAQLFVLTCFILIALPKAEAFGAGNIASISKIEGKNWRHGDIEDVLKLVACIKGHKWSSMMIKRVYFGNWLRDYSQAGMHLESYLSTSKARPAHADKSRRSRCRHPEGRPSWCYQSAGVDPVIHGLWICHWRI